MLGIIFFILVLILIYLIIVKKKLTININGGGELEKLVLEDLIPSWNKLNGKIPTKQSNKTRIMTWNIHCGRDASGNLNEMDMIKLIESADPDILCLQEVTVPSKIYQHFLDKYQTTTKCETVEGISNVTFSKFGDVMGVCFPLSDRRVCTRQIIPLTQKKKIGVYNVHLTVGRKFADDRVAEVEKLAELMQDDSSAKIVLGDFNAPPGDPIHKIFKSSKYKTTSLGPTSIYGKQVDWIYTLGLSSGGKQTKINTPLSDHLPILFDF